MIKKGFTAIALNHESMAWKGRRACRNETLLPRDTRCEVVSSRRNRWGGLNVRASIDGVVYTLSWKDWSFTAIRVGELRQWKDDRDPPFIVLGIDSFGCHCLSPVTHFKTSLTYLEDNTRVISEAG